MSVNENDATLVGLDWQTWQKVTQTRGFSAISVTNCDAAAMPSQKSVCYGFYPSIEIDSMLLVKCESCKLFLKDVGYGHHMRSQHGYSIDSSSGDECQSFLLSPPHRVVSPRFTGASIPSPAYRRASTSFASSRNRSHRNGNIASGTASPRYSVEQKDDLRLSLRVSKHEWQASGEADSTNNTITHNGAKTKVDTNSKIARPSNNSLKKKKKRRRDSSDEDNFCLEHFRLKKRLFRKEQKSEESEASPSNVCVRERDVRDGFCKREKTASHKSTITSSGLNGSLRDEFSQIDVPLPNTINAEPIDSMERLQDHDKTFSEKKCPEVVANSSEQWNDVDLETHNPTLFQDVIACPTLKFEEDETQKSWMPDSATLSVGVSVIESQLCGYSETNPFCVPSPPHVSPIAEKECCLESVTSSNATQGSVFQNQINEKELSQSCGRPVPSDCLEMVVRSGSSPNLVNGLEKDACDDRLGSVVLEENVKDINIDGGDSKSLHCAEERIVVSRLQEEFSNGTKSQHTLHDEGSLVDDKVKERELTVMHQNICPFDRHSHCSQPVPVTPVPQNYNRTCSSPPVSVVSPSGLSYRDVYVDEDQEIYYPNARLLTVPVSGESMDYPPQTRSSPPDISSTEQKQCFHDLPEDVERSPQLPSVPGNMIEKTPEKLHNLLQLTQFNLGQHFNQVGYSFAPEQCQFSFRRNPEINFAAESISEDSQYGSQTPFNFYESRNSNCLPQMTRRKEHTPRVICTVRSHVNVTQQSATSQVVPHEVCVPIPSRSMSRPEFRFVYIPSKSRYSDLNHKYNPRNTVYEKEGNNFDCTILQDVKHQIRAEPTIKKVAVQKIQPTVLNRIRSSAVVTGNVKNVNLSAHRETSYHRFSSRVGTRSFPINSGDDIMRISSKNRIYVDESCGLHSCSASDMEQCRSIIAGKSKQYSGYSPSYQIQENSTFQQVHKTKMSADTDDLECHFGSVCSLLRSGFLKTPKDFYCLSK